MSKTEREPISWEHNGAFASDTTVATRATTAPVVAIQGANHAFGRGENRIQVLYDNHLNIYPGEVVIMTGPSGSGKTTLLTLIGALRAAQDGSLNVMGNELRGMGYAAQVKVRRNIGFIFQAHNLFESLTAYRNVKIATEFHKYAPGEAKARSENILKELELGDHLHKKPKHLSGGQRQRVAIGRALVNRPKLILADELTTALDQNTGRLVVNLFQKMAKTEGTAVIIVTHDNRILDVADRIVRMVDGYVESDVQVEESVAIATFLKRCPMFGGAEPTLIVDVANNMRRESHPRGRMVIRQGEEGDKFYIIESGRAEVTVATDGGPEVVNRLGPGDFFGEQALISQAPRNATVTVVTDAELLTLSKDLFIGVVDAIPSFENQLRRVYFSA